MKTLLLFRGAPGAGKSTLIKRWGIKGFALSPDEMRTLYESPNIGVDGQLSIGFHSDKKVWETIYKIAESRFARGEFTVIDATNSQTHEILQWKNLAKKYGYRIYLCDMTDVPIEECKRRNNGRTQVKRVPEEAIEKMYARFATQPVPSGVTIIKPDEIRNLLWKCESVDKFDAVNIIGDVHGCMTALNELRNFDEDVNELYIFVGDLCDRGIENAEVVKFFIEHAYNPNFIFLEGNHEKHLRAWANDKSVFSKEFNLHTAPQLAKAGIKKKDLRKALQKLQQCFWFSFRGEEYFVSHGGIPVDPKSVNPLFIPTCDFINGVGEYEDVYDVDRNFSMEATDRYDIERERINQVHGHRNPETADIDHIPNTYNLEASVEFGGHLRALRLDREYGKRVDNIKNEVYRIPEEIKVETVEKFVNQLQSSSYIAKKSVAPDLYSFNFTSQAFRHGIWDGVITKARGLFINTTKNRIVARSYDKFFNLGEMENESVTLRNMKYPVKAYLKENGFLGILAWDDANDDLMFCSKSKANGPYADMFKQAFLQTIDEGAVDAFREFLKDGKHTMVFEVIHENDPHIIKYEGNKVVLLDIVSNEIEFKRIPYDTLYRNWLAYVPIKRCIMGNIRDEHDLRGFIEKISKAKGIEGVVLEDTDNFMVKVKTDYYNSWKMLRRYTAEVVKTGRCRTGGLKTDEKMKFYEWMRTRNIQDHAALKQDFNGGNIIKLRDMFNDEKQGKILD